MNRKKRMRRKKRSWVVDEPITSKSLKLKDAGIGMENEYCSDFGVSCCEG